jgi:hypothetical protein
MSATLSLGEKYGSFFWGCTKFAVSPYTGTFRAILNNDKKDNNIIVRGISAGIICGVLTFVVPILPAIASFTFALASIAMLLATASMFVTYPFALLADAFRPPSKDANFDTNELFGLNLMTN